MIFLALSERLFNKVKKILEDHDLKYKLIEDGETLFRLAKKEKPDLIILEKDIPLLDGFATVLLIKSEKNTQDIPIVAICKSNLKEEEIKAKDSGCDEVINCPIDENSFWEKIRKYLKK